VYPVTADSLDTRTVDAPAESYRVEAGLILLTAVAVAVFILMGIGRPIWQDDANAVLISNHGFPGLLEALRQDNNLPVYYVLLSVWMRLFGESEPALRSLSVVFYLAGAGVVFLLGKALYGSRRTGLYAALLYLSSAQLIQQAQAVRMYTLLGLLSAASLLLWVRIFVRGARSPWLVSGYVALNCIGMLTQVWFFFVLFGQFLYQAFRLPGRLKKLIASMALSGLVFVAVWGSAFIDQLHNGSTHWIPAFHPIFVLDILVEFYGAKDAGVLLLLACAVPFALAARPVRQAFWREDATRILLLVFLACILVPLAVSIAKPIYFPARYSTVALPALAVLLGAILTRVASRPYGAVICCGIVIATMAMHIRDRNVIADGGHPPVPPGHSDRSTAEYLLKHASAGDRVVFTNLTRAAADYYFRRAGAEGRFVEASFPEDLDQHAGWRERAARQRHSEPLAVEAAQFAERLKAATPKGSSVWVYRGIAGAAEVLNSKLESSLKLAQRYDLHGPYHFEVLRYTAR
jgi:hypothetical protein